ncbi:hypothetical protein GOBAR_AA27705 [Gossypium barbadense]|uniref:Uncharacterized protein n=1 Tax=Gossypium barbadense TaxID=3634 RepID=A0A2P5WPF1_GOSBA|nr:hypothetical protein GOBAR_AA27705 [Gossypium barbadense]
MGIIGIYSLGGVGKTTLLTQINNKFSTTPNGFDVVIWALVSKDYDVGKVQDRIGGNLGFSDDSWKNKSVDQKATDIYRVLRYKKFVVLLDDLWERVDLNQVGIPKPSKRNGSKLIFTTRSLAVCGEMEARKKIKVECLKSEEAWKLFQDKVGDETLNSHPDIRELAKQVAKRCGGLPLALITICRAMACKTTCEEWNYAIKKLKRSSLTKMKNEVFPLLKCSFDNFPVTTQSCFLYCCLYPEDYRIPKKRLVEYWFCEWLLNQFDKFSEAQMQGDCIISSLLSACLLERDGEDFVKMHDVIRDMALWITWELKAKENFFFVKAGAQLFEEIRYGYFEHVRHLTVLNLSENRGLKTLPMEISRLFSLECLDLSYTGIRELPIELKSLTKLKMLDLSYMEDLRRIARHQISSFSMLQIFRMNCLTMRDDGDAGNVLNGANMERLEEIFFCDCGIMEMKMEKLHIEVPPSPFHALSQVTIGRCHELKDATWLVLVPNLRFLWINKCLKMEEILRVGKLGEVAYMVGIPSPKPFLKLESVHLTHVPKLNNIYQYALPFPCLKNIFIDTCPELRELPLNSDSAKGNQITIWGESDWWERVIWENEATRDAFLPSFKPVLSEMHKILNSASLLCDVWFHGERCYLYFFFQFAASINVSVSSYF